MAKGVCACVCVCVCVKPLILSVLCILEVQLGQLNIQSVHSRALSTQMVLKAIGLGALAFGRSAGKEGGSSRLSWAIRVDGQTPEASSAGQNTPQSPTLASPLPREP